MDNDVSNGIQSITPNETTQLRPGATDEPVAGHRRLSARDGFILLISIQIGSGIFTSPSQVDSNVASPMAALLAWLVAGALAWSGATAFAELGTTLPRAGALQEYIRYIYGDIAAFLAMWIWILAAKTAAMATLSILFVGSICSGLSLTPSIVTQKLLACLVLLIVAMLNCSTTKPSDRIGEAYAILKLSTVALIGLSSFYVVLAHLIDSSTSFGTSDWFTKNWFQARHAKVDWPSTSWWLTLGHFSAAVHGAFWAFSGWDNANFITGEMAHPERNLPIAIHSSMGTVIACFLLTNISYYILLPWDGISQSDATAVIAARALLGTPGKLLVAVLVAISCAGALNGNFFVIGRLAPAAADLGYLPNFFSRYWTINLPSLSRFWKCPSGRYETDENRALLKQDKNNFFHETSDAEQGAPLNAILLGTIIAATYILFCNFRILVTLIGIAEYSFFFLAVLGLVVLRFREPDLYRPYKSHVVISVVFCIVSFLVVVRAFIFVPFQGLTLSLLLMSGVGFRTCTKGMFHGKG
ncbi:amino acid/polyamine transporter I [Tricladium varicosporioides]|nr:amino acid/polyamine transporter I [Hymenoscyphus varicosporioides]